MPTSPDDPFDLQRFVEAQALNYADAIAELEAGRKRSHWSWYVLPQLRGLGTSPMAIRYGISGLAEAQAYLAHPLLGTRLNACVAALNAHAGASATGILGGIDAMKFRSCVTLFRHVPGAGPSFDAALAQYFGNEEDPATVALLAAQAQRR